MLLRTTLLILLVLPLSGCSAFGFLFERLAWLSSWQLDRLFEIDQAQKQTAAQGAEELSGWLVEEGFPGLIAELEIARNLWNDGQDTATIKHLEQVFDDSQARFLEALAPALAPFLASLNSDNAAHFRRYNQAHLRDWYEYAESDTAKREFRLTQISRWFGDLNDSQVRLVAESVKLLPREREIRIENNGAWTEAMLAAALRGDQQALDAWLRNPSSWWTDAYRRQQAENRNQLLNTVNALLPGLTSQQQVHFGKRLEKWIKTLRDVLPNDPHKTTNAPGTSGLSPRTAVACLVPKALREPRMDAPGDEARRPVFGHDQFDCHLA